MLLELAEPLVDGVPAGRDEVDEQAEVVDARVALREDVSLEPLEPPEHLVHQAADLGELASERPRCGGDALLDRGADLLREPGLELGRGGREVLETLARACENRVDVGRLGPPIGGFCEALPSALDDVLIHRAQG